MDNLKIQDSIHYTLRMDGKYIGFLNNYGKKDKFIEEYANSLAGAGGISPISVSLILGDYKKMDLHDEVIRY